jgi:hypothetical protein
LPRVLCRSEMGGVDRFLLPINNSLHNRSSSQSRNLALRGGRSGFGELCHSTRRQVSAITNRPHGSEYDLCRVEIMLYLSHPPGKSSGVSAYISFTPFDAKKRN